MELAPRLLCALFVLVLGGAGCATAWVQERRLAPTGLAPNDTVAIIVTAPIKEEALAQLESPVAQCVQSALGEMAPGIKILPPQEFRKLVFPDLSANQLPSDYYAWQRLLREPLFNGKIAPLGLRYVLALNAEQGRRLSEVEWTAATSMLGGPGPSLTASWENEVLLEAIVVDAARRRIAGAVHAYAKGHSGAGVSLVTFPAPFLLPHGMPSFPFAVACRGLGDKLAAFLADKDGGEGQAAGAR
jgi:hypothetical protein